jgi:hypothetical protein
MQDVMTQAPIVIEAAAPGAAAQAATYAAADVSSFAATQAAAQQSVASAGELVKSSGEAAMSAGEVVLLAAEAAGATAAGIITGVALPVIAGGIGVVGLCGMGYYAWKHKGWTFKGIKESFDQARAEASTPGTWPEWNGHNVEAIWNDDQLLEEATRNDEAIWADDALLEAATRP